MLSSFDVAVVVGQSCQPDCTYCVEPGYEITWAPLQFSTTIVAATVIEIINTDVHTTRLSTISNDLPSSYIPPTDTNAQGTRTTQVTYTRTGRVLTTDM